MWEEEVLALAVVDALRAGGARGARGGGGGSAGTDPSAESMCVTRQPSVSV